MFVHALIAAAIAQSPTSLEPKIVSAIVLKSGITLLVREAPIPRGKGDFRVEDIPAAYDGTFWYGADNARVRDVTTTLRFIKKHVTRKAQNYNDLLMANIGKPVRLKIQRAAGEDEWVDGIIEDAGSAIGIRKGDLVRFIQFQTILELDTSTLHNKEISADVDWPVQDVRFTADANKATNIRFMSLETGAVWAGSYLVDIAGERAEVDGKAQLALGGLRFDNVAVQLLAGEPKMQASWKFDLASGIGSVQGYVSGHQPRHGELRKGERDPYERLDEVFRAAATALQSRNFGYGGGFGGGGFGGGGDPGVREIERFTPDRSNTQTPADPAEDVFLYDLGRITLQPGDRLTRPLVNMAIPYELVHTYEQSSNPKGVQKSLRLRNDSNVPLTPGTCLVLKDGKLLANTTMPFAAKSQKANIDLGGVLDVKVFSTGGTVKREQVKDTKPPRYLLTDRKTFFVENPREEAIDFELTTEVDGRVVDDGGGTITDANPYFARSPVSRYRVQWRFKVPPRSHKKVEVLYTYTTYN